MVLDSVTQGLKPCGGVQALVTARLSGRKSTGLPCVWELLVFDLVYCSNSVRMVRTLVRKLTNAKLHILSYTLAKLP